MFELEDREKIYKNILIATVIGAIVFTAIDFFIPNMHFTISMFFLGISAGIAIDNLYLRGVKNG